MGETSIEWTDRSVNPLRAMLGNGRGHYCEKISPGCKNCYSSAQQPRFRMPMFQEQRSANVTHHLDKKALLEVLRRRAPTKWFWCDMTDMFGDWVPDEWIAACFGIMAATPHHTHQVLTKRADRLPKWFQWFSGEARKLPALVGAIPPPSGPEGAAAIMFAGKQFDANFDRYLGKNGAWSRACHATWPLPNVWLGVSAEDQKRADERIPHLLATPAAIRFVSAEPLLGPLDLEFYMGHLPEDEDGAPYPGGLDWVIVGGESGRRARPCEVDWIRSIVRQCREAEAACFVKQLGSVSVETHPLSNVTINDRAVKLHASYGEMSFTRHLEHKGGRLEDFPADLIVRQFPKVAA